jgi:hypothetical protein
MTARDPLHLQQSAPCQPFCAAVPERAMALAALKALHLTLEGVKRMEATAISHIAMCTRDMEQSLAFYRDILARLYPFIAICVKIDRQ